MQFSSISILCKLLDIAFYWMMFRFVNYKNFCLLLAITGEDEIYSKIVLRQQGKIRTNV